MQIGCFISKKNNSCTCSFKKKRNTNFLLLSHPFPYQWLDFQHFLKLRNIFGVSSYPNNYHFFTCRYLITVPNYVRGICACNQSIILKLKRFLIETRSHLYNFCFLENSRPYNTASSQIHYSSKPTRNHMIIQHLVIIFKFDFFFKNCIFVYK